MLYLLLLVVFNTTCALSMYRIYYSIDLVILVLWNDHGDRIWTTAAPQFVVIALYFLPPHYLMRIFRGIVVKGASRSLSIHYTVPLHFPHSRCGCTRSCCDRTWAAYPGNSMRGSSGSGLERSAKCETRVGVVPLGPSLPWVLRKTGESRGTGERGERIQTIPISNRSWGPYKAFWLTILR